MIESPTQWGRVAGGITRNDPIEGFTTIRLSTPWWAQAVSVETARLERVPGTLKRILDGMVVDIEKRMSLS